MPLKRFNYSIIILLLYTLSGITIAQNYPERRDVYINDYANNIQIQQQDYLRELLIDLYSQTGVEMTLVVIESKLEYGIQDIQQFANGLFSAWGMSESAGNRNVLMAVSLVDREMVFAIGDGYDPAKHDELAERVIVLYPYFQAVEYKDGIFQGLTGAIQILTGLDYSTFPEVITPSVTAAPPQPTMTVSLVNLPERADPYYNADSAAVISSAYIRAIRDMLRHQEETNNVPITVLVVSNIDAYLSNRDSNIVSFVPRVYAAWDLGGAPATTLIVLSMASGEIRVQQSRESTDFDPVLRSNLENAMRPAWQNGDTGKALYEGVKQTILFITGESPAETYQVTQEDAIEAIGGTVDAMKDSAAGGLILAALVMVGIGVLSLFLRRSRR